MVGVVENSMTLQAEEQLRKWLEALRSGDYNQGLGAMCRVRYDGGRSMCCIGVLDEVVLGTSWQEGHKTAVDIIMEDDNGEEGNLPESAVAHLGLANTLNDRDIEVFREYGVELAEGDTRVAALAMLNDNGADFDTIAMVIENLGWDKVDA